MQKAERFEFYRLAADTVAKVVTADLTKGGNILLRKGVVTAEDITVSP